jgi:hypothetical protein
VGDRETYGCASVIYFKAFDVWDDFRGEKRSQLRAGVCYFDGYI